MAEVPDSWQWVNDLGSPRHFGLIVGHFGNLIQVTEPESVEAHIALPYGVDAAGVARRFVKEHFESLPADMVSDAELLVSELVTNAVQHGRPTVSLWLRRAPALIGVSVADEGDQLPALPGQLPQASASAGRGLLIVDRLSDEWGVSVHDPPPGKTVWFRLGFRAGE
jgi:anti-sigma regulatory factor (Ser/Thr protein kinase)